MRRSTGEADWRRIHHPAVVEARAPAREAPGWRMIHVGALHPHRSNHPGFELETDLAGLAGARRRFPGGGRLGGGAEPWRAGLRGFQHGPPAVAGAVPLPEAMLPTFRQPGATSRSCGVSPLEPGQAAACSKRPAVVGSPGGTSPGSIRRQRASTKVRWRRRGWGSFRWSGRPLIGGCGRGTTPEQVPRSKGCGAPKAPRPACGRKTAAPGSCSRNQQVQRIGPGFAVLQGAPLRQPAPPAAPHWAETGPAAPADHPPARAETAADQRSFQATVSPPIQDSSS